VIFLNTKGHPNVRVFITHGGLLGTQEAVHAGVPMIAIPLFADQYLNIRNCVAKGISVMVEYNAVTKESLSNALKTVLHDSRYSYDVKHKKHLFVFVTLV
jgi:glucuronosyltransferase